MSNGNDTQLFLLDAPFEDTGTVVALDDFEFHAGGLDGVEVDDVGGSLDGAIACGVLHFCPLACFGLVVEFPTVGNTATAPRTIVEPINGRGADGLWLYKVVGKPLGGVLGRPPMGVWHGAVVLVSRNEAVVDG